MIRFVAGQGRSTNHLSTVINSKSDISAPQYRRIDCSSEVAKVGGRAVCFPQHRVRSECDRRKDDVRAQTRCTDGLAFVVEPEGRSYRVAGERLEFADGAGPWSPDHRFIIENLRSGAVGRR